MNNEAIKYALQLAYSHLDMEQLRISHCKDAAQIDAALASLSAQPELSTVTRNIRTTGFDAQPEAEQPNILDIVAASFVNSFKPDDRLDPAYIAQCILTHKTAAALPASETELVEDTDPKSHARFTWYDVEAEVAKAIAQPEQPAPTSQPPNDNILRALQAIADFDDTRHGTYSSMFERCMIIAKQALRGWGCTRSHPHEKMNAECQRKTVQAHRDHAAASAPQMSDDETINLWGEITNCSTSIPKSCVLKFARAIRGDKTGSA